MAVYRFLEDAFIGGLYYQAGTTASTADTGGTLPINWVPNGNIDPIDTAAFNAFQAAGFQPQGLITTQFSALPVAPPNTRWVFDPGNKKYILVQGTAPYFPQGLFFDGHCFLTSFGLFNGLIGFPRVTFAGWFRSNWAPSTIWVIDPAVNNDPFLKVLPPLVGVASEGASENAQGFTGGPKMLWSSDLITWNQARFDSGYPAMQLFGGSLFYANKTWMIKFSDNANNLLGVYYLSTDGKNWSIAFKETPTVFNGILSFNNATNQWKIVLSGGQPQTVFINIPYAANPNFIPDDEPGYLADLSQTAVTNEGLLANNHLPNGWTAIRFNIGGANQWTFQYTTTPITTAVANSGVGWPAATWITTFSFDNTGPGQSDASNNQISLAQVDPGSGNTTNPGTIEFSTGNGIVSRLFVDAAPGSRNSDKWLHLMGTLDGTAGAVTPAALFINGSQVGNIGQSGTIPFGSVPTNGTAMYIGLTPGVNDFYIGDICDLAIWLDRSLPISGMNALYPQLVNGGVPVNPVNYVRSTALGRPDVFLTGPAATATGPIGAFGFTKGFFVGAGHLQDSDSSPRNA